MLDFLQQQRNLVLREIEQPKDAIVDFGFSDLAGSPSPPAPLPVGEGSRISSLCSLLPEGEGLGMRG
jgi:hypothetical protein